MKITYFINQYPNVCHTFIRREILALEKQGLDIQRIALRGWDAKVVDPEDVAEQLKTRYVLKAGILPLLLASMQVLIFQPIRFFKALCLALSMGWRADKPLPYHIIYFLEACLISDWIKTNHSKHMHAHFGTNPSEILMLVNAISDLPYSFTVHGSEEFDRPLFLKLGKKIAAAKFVVAISSFGRSQLQRWASLNDWPKIKQVHCGLEPSFYHDNQAPIADVNRMVCVGRLCEQKGQLLLIEAANALNQTGVDFELVLAGDGDMRIPVETLIAKYHLTSKVKITGWISSAQVREYLLSSKALVLPSFAEGLPVVIMEAMSLKRPVISTYIGGIPELVEHDKSGWLVPAGSIEHLVDAMRALLNTPAERLEAMGQHAYERVVARHDIDTEAKKLALLFNEGGIA